MLFFSHGLKMIIWWYQAGYFVESGSLSVDRIFEILRSLIQDPEKCDTKHKTSNIEFIQLNNSVNNKFTYQSTSSDASVPPTSFSIEN